MKPEIGKWYIISSSGKKGWKEAYRGKAKCIRESHFDETKSSWCFRYPNEPDKMLYFGYHIFKSQDIKKETTPEPTYEELKEEVERLKGIVRGEDSYENFDNSGQAPGNGYGY